MVAAAFVLIAVVGSAAPAGAASVAIPACEQTGPCVVVEVLGSNGERQSLSYLYADQIVGSGADISEASYPIKGGTDAIVKPGSSVNRLLGLAGVSDVTTVTFAEVVWDDDYRRHLLTGQEVRSGGAAGFPGGLLPAFYSAAPERLGYIRPQRNADDANGSPGPDLGTRLTDPQGSFLVRVHQSGQLLDVGVSAVPTDATNRTYTLTTDQAGGGLTFGWVLPDGTRSTEASPTFTFPSGSRAGTYPVSVGVEAPDGSFGWGSAVLGVGDPPTVTSSGSPTGAGGTGKAKAGPKKKPKETRAADPRPTGNGTGTGAGTGTGTESEPEPDPRPIPTLAPPPAPSTPTDVPTATAEPTPVSQTGETVTGILLTAAQPIDTSTDRRLTASPGAPDGAALGRDRITVPAAARVSVGALLLLLGGAASESASVRRLRRRWSRMNP